MKIIILIHLHTQGLERKEDKNVCGIKMKL